MTRYGIQGFQDARILEYWDYARILGNQDTRIPGHLDTRNFFYYNTIVYAQILGY